MAPMLQFTICFIRSGDEVLMLNRNKPANMGLWNGVGGKLDAGETPLDGALREVAEETGLQLADAEFSGIVTWNQQRFRREGMYAFLAQIGKAGRTTGATETREGILAWKPLDWVLHPDNLGVAPHVRKFLERMLRDKTRYEHRCLLRQGRLINYTALPLDEDFYRAHHVALPPAVG